MGAMLWRCTSCGCHRLGSFLEVGGKWRFPREGREGFGMLFVVIIYLVGRIFVCGMKHFWMLYVYLFMLRQWAGGYKKIKETETEI